MQVGYKGVYWHIWKDTGYHGATRWSLAKGIERRFVASRQGETSISPFNGDLSSTSNIAPRWYFPNTLARCD
jgi:hypothetical protein